jgi:hypothetical protein
VGKRLKISQAPGKPTELDREALDLKLLSSPHIRPQPSCKLSDHANKWRLSLGARPAGQESGIPMVSPALILGLEASRQITVGHLRLHPACSNSIRSSTRCPRPCGDQRAAQHASGRIRSRPRSLALSLGARYESAAGDARLCSPALSDGQIRGADAGAVGGRCFALEGRHSRSCGHRRSMPARSAQSSTRSDRPSY